MTPPAISERLLRSYLGQFWGLTDVGVAVHNAGMGSVTWFVDRGAERWVAKAVAASAGGQFAGGLSVAGWLEQAGIPAGAAVPLADGQLVADVGDGRLALLTWVPGRPLGTGSADQALMGTTLARVHRALAGREAPGAQRFHWVDPGASYLLQRAWLRPSVAAAVDALEAAGPAAMTQGLMHADPGPGAFRLDEATGRCGMIDWSYFQHGPLLYDLASAVAFAGGLREGSELVDAYLSVGALTPAEVDAGLEIMVRFRWAVQANYFAWRISENDLTGIRGPEDNERELERARRQLSAHPSRAS